MHQINKKIYNYSKTPKEFSTPSDRLPPSLGCFGDIVRILGAIVLIIFPSFRVCYLGQHLTGSLLVIVMLSFIPSFRGLSSWTDYLCGGSELPYTGLLLRLFSSFIPSFRGLSSWTDYLLGGAFVPQYRVATPPVLQLHPIFQGPVVLDRSTCDGTSCDCLGGPSLLSHCGSSVDLPRAVLVSSRVCFQHIRSSLNNFCWQSVEPLLAQLIWYQG
jgi:hypothetical protein